MKRIAIIMAALALILSGCSKSSGGSSSPTTSGGARAQRSAILLHLPVGSVTVSWSATTKSITVIGTMTGLAPNSIHPAHIHKGSCAKSGPIVHALANVVANASGVAALKSTVSKVSSPIPSSGWYLNVHVGPTGVDPAQKRAIACVDLTPPSAAKSGTQELTKSFGAIPGPGNNVQGTASVSYAASTKALQVVLTVSGLVPNSIHAAHIHAGSCEAQGAVVYPLKNVKADPTGSATVTTTLPNVAAPKGPLYVNIHSSTDLTTQVGFTPIACGNLSA